MEYLIVLLLIISFIVSLIFIYFLRELAIKHHLFDEPGNNKIHSKPIPYLGGIGIFAGVTITLIIAQHIRLIFTDWVIGIVSGGIIILALGFWDDLKWKQSGQTFLKLISQCLIGLIIIVLFQKLGISLQLSNYPLFAVLTAIFYFVVIINALNVNDGLDGLAGGMVGISLLGFMAISLISGDLNVFIICGIVLFSVLSFLIYNWTPASIFMGDNGSLFLGFLLAILTIIFSSYPFHNFRHFIGPLLIIGFPIFDIVWVIITRTAKGQSPFCKSRDYLYDKIYFKFGRSTPQTALICYLIQIVFVISGVLIY